MMRVRDSWWLRVVLAIAVFGLFLCFWQLVIVMFGIAPMILPSPLRVARAAISEWDKLSVGFLVTAGVALAALLVSIVIGMLTAILFSLSRLARAALYPYVIFLQTVPIVAIAPLLITWFGYGIGTIVLIATIISLFPIISNVTAGLVSVDDNLKDLFQLCGASRRQTMLKLRIPFAIRHLVLGARISAGLAVIGAIVGEFFVGETATAYAGLGTLIAGWQRMTHTDSMIAGIMASTLLGLAVLGSVNLAAHLLLRRWTAGEFDGG